MAPLRVGVIIGRFQIPKPHAGHLKLYEHVQSQNDQVVFLLGCSFIDGRCAENPLTFNQRSQILHRAFYDQTPRGIQIFALRDCRTNAEWSAQVDGILSTAFPEDAITLYGGRDSFLQSYQGRFKTEHVAHAPVVPDSGTSHRKDLKEGEHVEFYKGQIYALNHQFPKTHPTVDFAMTKVSWRGDSTQRYPSFETLIIQRADNGRWCFPGGFADPEDESYEFTAKRELNEELGMGSEATPLYVSSHHVRDFRYRGSRDQIKTALFIIWHTWGEPRPNAAEVSDFKWISPLETATVDICDTHAPLLASLRAKLTDFRDAPPDWLHALGVQHG